MADIHDLNAAIMASSLHLIISTDSNGIVTGFNKAAEKALGYRAEDVVGQQTPALWHDGAEVVARAEALSKELGRTIEPGFDVFIVKPQLTGGESREWTMIRKDKSSFPSNLTVTCIKNEQHEITGYLGVIEDISRRKKAESALDDAKIFEDLILENSPDLLFVKDENFRIVQANPAFLNLYPPGQRDKVIGYTTLEAYDEQEANEFLKNDRIAFKEGQSETYEKITFPNGDVRTLFTKKVRFKNERGEAFILGIGRDVTERENLINTLATSNEDLARFAYVCSHDLQEPLRMIRSFSEKLETHLETQAKLDDKGRKYFNFVISGAARAQDLISDILTYSSLNHDTQQFAPVDIHALIETVKANMAVSLETTGGKITCGPLPEVMGHKTQLFQVFQNLINNGLKYQPTGRQPQVHVSAEEQKSHWKFSVKDNGIGMDEKYLDKIFDIFQRLNKRSLYAGTGVGLSICKKIVERHGGEIGVTSIKGTGSTFTFTIAK